MFASPPCCRARIETTQQRGITGATSGRPTERHEDTEDNRRGRPLNKTTGIASTISEQRSVLAPLLPGHLPVNCRLKIVPHLAGFLESAKTLTFCRKGFNSSAS